MRIYLDHNATTPLHPEVGEAMARASRDVWGNPSSPHAEGHAARSRIESAREAVAGLLGVAPRRIVFNSGATEGNCSVFHGLGRQPGGGRRVLVSAVEHPSVSAPAQALEARGYRVETLPVDADGLVDPGLLESRLGAEVALVSVQWANHETGVLQPIGALAAPLRERGIPFHVDATQRAGRLPIDLAPLGLAALTLSAHKFNGPKGVGCLVLGEGALDVSLCSGGGQERGRRAGTENLLGIIGLGRAAEIAVDGLAERASVDAALRDRLWRGIEDAIPGVRRNGAPQQVLPNTLNVEFADTPGEVLLQALDLEGVAASLGAACSSGSIEPSPVLLAMGRGVEAARASLRFSLGLGVDAAQIDRVLALLPGLVARARACGRAA